MGIELKAADFFEAEPNASPIPSTPEAPEAKWWGTLVIGDVELPVYVLDDGRRVVSRTGAVTVLIGPQGGGKFESYLATRGLQPYLPADLRARMIEFRMPNVVNKNVFGISAEIFLDICNAYVVARDAGKLTAFQEQAAMRAGMFLAACAKVGLIALIDEATGYQYERAETALQFKLKLYLQEEMRKWERTFPDELWVEFQRLTRWPRPLHERPKYWGKLVIELIYEYLDPDVADWLRMHAPRPQHGQNYHQWLSDQYGLKMLIQHIWMVIGMARACHSMHELRTKMAEHYGLQATQITMFLPPPPPSASPHVSSEEHNLLNLSRRAIQPVYSRSESGIAGDGIAGGQNHSGGDGSPAEELHDVTSSCSVADAGPKRRSMASHRDEPFAAGVVIARVPGRERSAVEVRVEGLPELHVVAKDNGHKLGQTLYLHRTDGQTARRSTGPGSLRRDAVRLAAEWIREASADGDQPASDATKSK